MLVLADNKTMGCHKSEHLKPYRINFVHST